MHPDHTSLSLLEFHLLGAPEIHRNGEISTELTSAKAQALLYYLAMTQRVYTRTFLAGLLWGHQAEGAAQDNLRKVLQQLRATLGPALAIERHMVGLQAEQPYWVDAVAFTSQVEAALTADTLEPLQQVIALYRGDFLEGFYVREAPEFEAWMLSERARLREMMLQGLATLGERYASRNNLLQAITTGRRLLALEPWREEMHRQLMVWLLENGQRSAALAQYERCRRVLAEELDVAPAPETVQLYESILAAPAAVRAERPPSSMTLDLPSAVLARRSHNLPRPPTSFIGREAELTTIQQRLSDPHCRLLTLLGPGGVGKTRLGLQAADDQLANFEHGVYFVALAALDSAQQLVTTVLDTFQLSQQAQVNPTEQLLHYLRNKRLLFVLDNFEHLRDGVRLVQQILSAAPEVKLLVTSRERLKLQEEWLLPVAGMELPPEPVEGREEKLLNMLAGFSAIRLFTERARRVQPAFSLTAANAADVIQICRLVDALPLGIELAAAWLRLMSCADIAQEITRGFEFLTSAWQDLPPRHQSLHAVFEHSWQLLAPQEQASLCQLTVFRGGFRPPAAEAVAGTSLSRLADLVDKSWLRMVASGRFDMHELVRQFAASKLTQAATDPQPAQTEAGARARHSSYYAAFLHGREAFLQGPRQSEVLSELLVEVDNLRRGWRWAVDIVQVDLIGQYLKSWQWLGEVRCWNREMAQMFAEAAAQLKAQYAHLTEQASGNSLAQFKLILARSLYCQARHVFQLSLPRQVQTLCEECLAFWPDTGVSAEQAAERAQVKLLLGQTLYDQGRYDEAQQICRTAYHECLVSHDQVGLQEAFYQLGMNAYTQGNIAEAQALFTQSLTIANNLGEQVRKIGTMMMLGEILANQGDTRRAEQIAEEMYEVAERFGSTLGMLCSYLQLGYVAFLVRQLAQAGHYFQKSLSLSEEIGDQFLCLNSRRWLGNTAYGQHDYAAARHFFTEALAIARAVDRQVDVAIALTGLGYVACALGESNAAHQQFQQALAILQAIHAVPDLLHTLVGLSQLWIQLGNLEPATQLLAFTQQHPAVLPYTQSTVSQALAELQTKLSAVRFTVAYTAGRAMTLEEVLVLIQEEEAMSARGQKCPHRQGLRP